MLRNENIILKAYAIALTFLLQILCASSVLSETLYGKMELGGGVQMPFTVEKQQDNFFIKNGLEIIPLSKRIVPNTDSIDLVFPFFKSYMRCKPSRRGLNGYWHNQLKKNYKLPVKISRNRKPKAEENQPFIEGKWETIFSTSKSPYPAVGMFEIRENEVHGTFMTETGDYRFLCGYFSGDSIVLSAFDGSHAFLFTAKYANDTLRGLFYSGNHYITDWIAVKNENAALTNPSALTYIQDSEPFQFTFPDLNKNFYSFPNHINSSKATIVMLMGSWCPNCIDEAIFFKEVQQKYGSDQVKIIALCYEAGDDEKHWFECVQKLRDLHNFPFIFLVAGKANKNLAHQHFPMLNNVISFPTTFYIDKKGVVRKIYTGFYGPATKEYFENFKRETYALLDVLVSE